MSSPQWYNERVKHQLTREISWVIANKVRDPRIPPIVTISEMKLSVDTRNATVFVSLLNTENEDSASAIEALNRAAPFIQKIVAQRVKIKNFPKIHFKRDLGLEHSERINSLLDQIKDDLV